MHIRYLLQSKYLTNISYYPLQSNSHRLSCGLSLCGRLSVLSSKSGIAVSSVSHSLAFFWIPLLLWVFFFFLLPYLFFCLLVITGIPAPLPRTVTWTCVLHSSTKTLDLCSESQLWRYSWDLVLSHPDGYWFGVFELHIFYLSPDIFLFYCLHPTSYTLPSLILETATHIKALSQLPYWNFSIRIIFLNMAISHQRCSVAS